MMIAETLEWFKSRGYNFRAKYDNTALFMAEVARVGDPIPVVERQQDIGYYRTSEYESSDVVIRFYGLRGLSPDEAVTRLMRAVEALEGITT